VASVSVGGLFSVGGILVGGRGVAHGLLDRVAASLARGQSKTQ
jgi:hypothetical protein